MDIRIQLKQEREFLDVVFLIEKYHKKLDLSTYRLGKKYVTYIFPNEWFESLNEFDKLQITAFRI